MTLTRVEHAMSMMRAYLVERAAQSEEADDSSEELARTIVACIKETTSEARQKAPRFEQRLPREVLGRAVRYINDNLSSKLKWDEIASAVGVDPFAFGRGFKLATGMTPRQYIIRCRLRHAMKLLAKEQLALADIALEVGCACQSHLTTLFRKHLGTTPGAFRDSATGRSERVLRFTPATLRKDQSASDDTWPASQWAGRGIEDARHSEAAG